MKRSRLGLLALPAALLGLLPARADHPGRGDDHPAVMLPSKGRHHHPVAGASAEAQRYFDQGMTLLFGFDHEGAVRSFRRAAELAPRSPLPHWGVGLAL